MTTLTSGSLGTHRSSTATVPAAAVGSPMTGSAPSIDAAAAPPAGVVSCVMSAATCASWAAACHVIDGGGAAPPPPIPKQAADERSPRAKRRPARPAISKSGDGMPARDTARGRGHHRLTTSTGAVDVHVRQRIERALATHADGAMEKKASGKGEGVLTKGSARSLVMGSPQPLGCPKSTTRLTHGQ